MPEDGGAELGDDRRAALQRRPQAQVVRQESERRRRGRPGAPPSIVMVLAAFFDSGGLNAGTPFAIASTPVSATEPRRERPQEQEDRHDLGPERGRPRAGGVRSAGSR